MIQIGVIQTGIFCRLDQKICCFVQIDDKWLYIAHFDLGYISAYSNKNVYVLTEWNRNVCLNCLKQKYYATNESNTNVLLQQTRAKKSPFRPTGLKIAIFNDSFKNGYILTESNKIGFA